MLTLNQILDAYNSLGPGTHQHKALTAKLEQFGHAPDEVAIAINQQLAAGHLVLTPMDGIRKSAALIADEALANASGTGIAPSERPKP